MELGLCTSPGFFETVLAPTLIGVRRVSDNAGWEKSALPIDKREKGTTINTQQHEGTTPPKKQSSSSAHVSAVKQITQRARCVRVETESMRTP